jgi:uncharacterized protein
MVSDSALLPWYQSLRDLVGVEKAFDVHTHLGSNDPDGFQCTRDELIGSLERIGAGAFVFPMHEPDGYPPANDMVIEEAGRSDGRLIPFCRLDPNADPLDEARRCLDKGARGIKLHPRAEGFTLDHPELQPVFELADAERLPILVHAGRGIPALGRHSIEVCARHPDLRLILAHAGISDLAWIWHAARDLPNLYFDTSWWSAGDLLTLFTHVPPGQVLFGSDAPYATPTYGASMSLRYALEAGLTSEQIQVVAGGQLERLLAWEEPLDAGAPVGAGSLSYDPLLDRVYSFLVSALGQGFGGVEPTETLQLAGLACEVGEGAAQSEPCRMVLRLLEERSRYPEGTDGRPARFAKGLHLIVLAACVTRTPHVPLPELAEPVSPTEGRVAR